MLEDISIIVAGASLPATALIFRLVPKKQPVSADTVELQVVVRELRADVAEIKQELKEQRIYRERH